MLRRHRRTQLVAKRTLPAGSSPIAEAGAARRTNCEALRLLGTTGVPVRAGRRVIGEILDEATWRKVWPLAKKLGVYAGSRTFRNILSTPVDS